TADGGTVRLPFDPHEIIENLRHERYRNSAERDRTDLYGSPMVWSFYYWLRPLLPISVRRHVQRAYLSDWKTIDFPHWPVDRTVERFLEQLLTLSMKAQAVQTVPFIW